MVTDISAVEQRRGSLGSRAVAAAASTLAFVRSEGPARQVARFTWHYVQMAIAMEIGMYIGMAPPVLSLLGLSNPDTRSPEAYAVEMTVAMVLPMVAWMRIRRHPWRHTAEMSAGMSASTVVAVAASLAGLLPHTAAFSAPVGVLMWVGMLVAMLFRRRDYAQGHHGHGPRKKAAA